MFHQDAGATTRASSRGTEPYAAHFPSIPLVLQGERITPCLALLIGLAILIDC